MANLFNKRASDVSSKVEFTKEHMKTLLTTMTSYLRYLLGEEPLTQTELDNLTREMMQKWNKTNAPAMDLEAVHTMFVKEPLVGQYLYEMGLITLAEKDPDMQKLDDCDSDLELEVKRSELACDEEDEKIRSGIEAAPVDETGANKQGTALVLAQDYPWINQIKELPKLQVPANQVTPPSAHLEIKYIYGYRCDDQRNSLYYGSAGQVVYNAAGIGINLNPTTNQQRFFTDHNDDILCMDVQGDNVVTGQVGNNPYLCCWNLKEMTVQALMRGDFELGIANCRFSNNGKMIAATGLDDMHRLVIYDYEMVKLCRKDPDADKSKAVIAKSNLSKDDILHIQFSPDDTIIMACGLANLYFIVYEDNVIRSTKAAWQTAIQQIPLCGIFLEIDGQVKAITGMQEGQLYVWNPQDTMHQKTLQAHSKAVAAIVIQKKRAGFITGGKDGFIFYWSAQLDKLQTLSYSMSDLARQNLSFPNIAINSLCENMAGDLLVGLRGCSILEFKAGSKTPKVLMQGHWKKQLWSLCTHPRQPFFYSCGEDGMIFKYSIIENKIVANRKVKNEGSTGAISPDGQYLAIGTWQGVIYILDPENLSRKHTIRDRINPDLELLKHVKFSPDGQLLAATYGSPVNELRFYDVTKQFEFKSLIKLTSPILSFDWSSDLIIQSNNEAWEIVYYDVKTGKESKNLKEFTSTKFDTFSLTLHQTVKGIWPPCSQGTDINCVVRHPKDEHILVTGDDFSKIKLFRYPASQIKAGFNKFQAHSSGVSDLAFSYDGEYLLSIGGLDRCVIVWKYISVPEELPEDMVAMVTAEDDEEEDAFGEEETDKGDQAGAVKPFLGEVKHSVPTGWTANVKRDNVLPNESLRIHYAHGYRTIYISEECRNMAVFTNKDQISFPAAALGVVQEGKNGGQQTFFQQHQEDIVSYGIHPKRNIIASGQMAQKKKAKAIDLHIWNTETKESLANFNTFHQRAVVICSFSPDGTILLSVGNDDNNSLALYDWQGQRIVCTAPVDKARVTSASWKNQTEFVTTGHKHVKFWTVEGKNIKGVQGTTLDQKFNSQFSSCYAFDGKMCVTGSGTGALYVWTGNSGKAQAAVHEGKVQTLIFDKTKKVVLSGGADGKVISWTESGGSLVQQKVIIDIKPITQFAPGVLGLDISSSGKLLAATAGSEIYEILNDKAEILLQGHYEGELWGASTSPDSLKFVSSGGDKTIRIWDIKTHKMIAATPPLKNDVRAVDWSSNGKFIIAADQHASLIVFSTKDLKQISETASLFSKEKKQQSDFWSQDIKFSPDSSQMAFGVHGTLGQVEIWKVDGSGKLSDGFQIKSGMTSTLIHVDWSEDGQFLVANSRAYELKYYNVGNKKTQASSGSKDIVWKSFTCKFGWPVQGIWQGVNYSDVYSVDCSKSKKMIAVGYSDQQIRLFKYPCVVEKQVHKPYFGHASYVCRVRFTFNDQFLVSVGGNDKTVLVWEIPENRAAGGSMASIEAEEEAVEVEVPVEKKKKSKKQKKQKTEDLSSSTSTQASEVKEVFGEEDLDKGDEFMAVKPWLGAIKAPSVPYYQDKDQALPPPIQLAPDYVYGYRTKDQRNNLKVVSNNRIVYNAAAIGIVHDLSTNTQKFFRKHIDDIISMAIHPNGELIATGEIGPKPSVYVWNVNTMEDTHCWKAVLKKGVCALAFSPSGNQLVAAAIDVDHEIAVFDLTTKASKKFVKTPEVITDLVWQNEDNFVSVGVKHYKQWTVSKGSGKKGTFKSGNNQLNEVIAVGNKVYCGAANGVLQVWNGTELASDKLKLHEGVLDALAYHPPL